MLTFEFKLSGRPADQEGGPWVGLPAGDIARIDEIMRELNAPDESLEPLKVEPDMVGYYTADQMEPDLIQFYGLTTCASISVDISFNDQLACVETEFFRRTVVRSAVACQLLVWLKYWTKLHGINDPKHGSLSSFGWRCILVAVLGEIGVVPCLRAGKHGRTTPTRSLSRLLPIPCDDRSGFHDVAVSDILSGINISMPDLNATAAAPHDTWQCLNILAEELAGCVRSPKLRLFQMVAVDRDMTNRKFDAIWDAMQATLTVNHLTPAIEAAAERVGQRCPSGVCKLIFCDVDGCLFEITPELLAGDLADEEAFFFNSEDSIPTALAPLVHRFLSEAATTGWQIVIVSGRDESILPSVRHRIEESAADGAAKALQPLCYLFKSTGSR